MSNIVDQIMHPEDITNQFSPDDIASGTGIAAVTTIPFMFWLPMAAARGNQFCKHYANQSFLLLLLCTAVSITNTIFWLLFGLIPIVGDILSGLLGLCLNLVTFAVFLLLLISALQGRARVIPVIGNLFRVFK